MIVVVMLFFYMMNKKPTPATAASPSLVTSSGTNIGNVLSGLFGFGAKASAIAPGSNNAGVYNDPAPDGTITTGYSSYAPGTTEGTIATDDYNTWLSAPATGNNPDDIFGLDDPII